MRSFSAPLLAHIHEARRQAGTIDATQRRVVIANLTFLYSAVVASEQLLKEAAAAAELPPRDHFSGRLAAYYRAHLEEERGHAAWLHDDLAAAGAEPGLPDRGAMAMVGTQYYLLKHRHPAALLGYMAVVEGDPTPEAAVELLEALHGEKLLRFVRFHAHKDLEHRRELCEVIDGAPRQMRALIAYSAQITLDYFAQAAAGWA